MHARPHAGGVRESAGLARDEGFAAIKIAPFDGLTPALCGGAEGRALVAAGVARIAGAAERLGGQAALMVDCHWRLDPAEARRLIPQLADLGVTWFECPLPETPNLATELAALRRLCHRHDVRLAGLELMTSPQATEPFARAGAYDVWMPDIKYAGGYAGLAAFSRAAHAAGADVSLHNPSGPIAHLASLHATAALPPSPLPLESQWRESPIFEMATRPAPPAVEAGASRLPEGAGLGARLEVERDACG